MNWILRVGSNRTVAWVLVVTALVSGAPLVSAADHFNKNVRVVQAGHITTECFYFWLDGVAEAAPASPGNPWFAVSRSQAGAKEMYATLLASRVSGIALYQVQTNGQLICGYPQATAVLL